MQPPRQGLEKEGERTVNLERARYYQENMDRLMQTARIFLRNPVFVTGLGLAPIVVAANSLSHALI